MKIMSDRENENFSRKCELKSETYCCGYKCLHVCKMLIAEILINSLIKIYYWMVSVGYWGRSWLNRHSSCSTNV